ncbi:GNAT family N-acetyltransferase [Microbacterium sp.]|uniref:GNAT family N-acetyltransferase n=1 Tax=Microbacterium sp. TaxID=51671 RepID=UPI0025EE6FCE|nr:GNAT family N-acetyltransferase [Microbacterium sp.]
MVTLREEPVDAPGARELLAEYFAMRAATFPGHAYTTVFPHASVFQPPGGVFVVVRDDQDQSVGCGGIRRIDDGALGPRYEVKHLYLRPQNRGRGWGRVLLEDLEHRAIAFGARELVLDTHHTLEAAGRLYVAAGFEAVDPYNDNPNATRWYAKALEADQTG